MAGDDGDAGEIRIMQPRGCNEHDIYAGDFPLFLFSPSDRDRCHPAQHALLPMWTDNLGRSVRNPLDRLASCVREASPRGA